MRLVLVVLGIVGVLLSAGPAVAGQRVALVVGNDDYAVLPDLANASKDAQDMAAKLGDLGFEVLLLTNAEQRDLFRALSAFEGKLQTAEAGLVYFAGHGVQVEGRNWLIPADARVEFEEDLPAEGVDVASVLDAMVRGGAAVNIVILDACRDNPLRRRSRSAVRGLAVAAVPSGIKGAAVMYAAAPGEKAADGPEGGNGVFTGALLESLSEPGLTVEQVFKATARKVQEQTGGRQRPWINASLTGDFYFQAPDDRRLPSTGPANAVDREVVFWLSVKDSRWVGDYEEYLRAFPDGTFAGLARARIEVLKARPEPALPVVPESARVDPSVIEMDGSFVTVKTADLRLKPTTSSEKVGVLPAETSVRVTGRLADGSWIRVAHSGRTAWVWAPLVQAADARLAVLPIPATPTLRASPPPRHPGDEFRDCEDCPELVVLPPGEFTMGSSAGERARENSEGPQHRVRIGYSFAVGKYEVTFDEWDACLADGGCGEYRPYDQGWGRGRRPVINVSWDHAQAYVRWLSRKTGRRYRLLSEAEWEYAARAGTTSAFYTGDRITPDQANFDGRFTYGGSSPGVYRQRTVPVGSFGANRFGLHNMPGNAWEWVEDCWNGNYAGAPSDGTAWASGDCGHRVLRGGSWVYEPRALRSAKRGRFDTGYRNANSGFRVARTL